MSLSYVGVSLFTFQRPPQNAMPPRSSRRMRTFRRQGYLSLLMQRLPNMDTI